MSPCSGECMNKPKASKKGRVFAIANFKGGVGRSCLAFNLACYLNEVGKAALLDLDAGQPDSERFSGNCDLMVRRVANAEDLYGVVDQLCLDAFDVVIDCPPCEKAKTQLACYMASAVVMPIRPQTNDAYDMGRLLSMLREIRHERPELPIYTVCNFFKNAREAISMVELLKQMGAARFLGKLWERNEYSAAMGDGRPVWEAFQGQPAAVEMRGFCEALNRMVMHA